MTTKISADAKREIIQDFAKEIKKNNK